MKYGMLTIGPATDRRKGGELLYHCTCDCGGSRLATKRQLRSGQTKSCGCLARKYSASGSANPLWKGGAKARHDAGPHSIWRKMIARCTDPHNHKFMYYGARGIRVDPRWLDFATFERDMGPRPSPQHSIDRIDNDGPYSPENCRWATQREQQRNKRPRKVYEVHGLTLTVSQIAAVLGSNPDKLAVYMDNAIAGGATVEQALWSLIRPAPTPPVPPR